MKRRERLQEAQLWMTLFVIVLLSLLPSPLLAHAQLLRSIPANRAELAQAPKQIEVWFNELLEDGFDRINVFPAAQLQSTSRTNLVDGKPAVDRTDRTHLTALLKPLGAGEYVVEWRVLSRDGHSAPGRFTFRVLPQK